MVWQKGQSGNPAGRPKKKTPRQKLTKSFVESLMEDFDKHGKKVIQKLREDDPGRYLRVIANILPRVIHLEDHTPLENMTDDQLVAQYRETRRQLAAAGFDPDGNGTAEASGTEQAPKVPPVH